MIEQKDLIKVNKIEDTYDLHSEESIYETNSESELDLYEEDE